MKKLFLSAVTAATIFLSASSAKAQTFNAQLGAMLQDSLDMMVASITNIKGFSASVYLPGQGIWQGTAGVSYAGQPITSDMEFGIASNTKLFVSAVMLKLEENNVLSLDDSLHSWLPTYPNINPNITIRQLLNHTSGVQDPIFLSPWMDTIMANPTRVFTPVEVLSWVGAPVFAPGTSWGYSNVNYILAGMIAQAATGFHISRLIRDSILTPLNLDSTFYDVEETIGGIVSHRWYNSVDYNDTSRVGLNTAGGCAGAIFSNSGDMAKWYHALFSGQLLSPVSYAELTTFVNTFGPPYTYGLGLESQVWWGHITYAHGGVTWGYKSRMVYDPCMGAVVCGLVNSWPAGNDGVTLTMLRILINHVPGCGSVISGATNICRKQNNVTYTATPIANATTYIWTLPPGASGTSSTNSITVNYGASAVSGTITVRGNNQYGDGAVSSLDVTVDSVNTSVSANENALFVDVAADSYQWLDCNNGFQPILGQTGQTFIAPNGNFAVQITDNGCVDTSECILVTGVGIDSPDGEENEVTIQPNPFSSETLITFKNISHNAVVKVFDMVGRCIQKVAVNSNELALDMSAFAKGIYFLQLTDEMTVMINKKLVMQ